MKISSKMIFSELAEHMGSDATRDDAMVMRELLVRNDWTGYDTAEIPQHLWESMVCEAYAIASGNR